MEVSVDFFNEYSDDPKGKVVYVNSGKAPF